jgi:lipopolysaccharide transport system ATP-binding protein
MSDIVISAENLGKRYRIGERERYLALRDILARAVSAPARLFRAREPSAPNGDATHIWALKDVSFEVRQGEVLGMIGRNGAGKTTLLKILAQVTRPTEGRARLRGRVGSLLEVGTGFHPELTGRENVYLSGAILGMGKKEIERKFDEMVAFAEVEKFIDTPLKHYSSGMQMRLAFAVAAHLEPEILLVDEVLAVGDIEFQRKCLGKMGDVARAGRTVLFVSHNMGAITRLCPRSIWIERGAILRDGATGDVTLEYQGQYLAKLSVWNRPCGDFGTGELKLLRVSSALESGSPACIFRATDGIVIEICYMVVRPLTACQIGVRVYNAEGLVVLSTSDADYAGVSALPKSVGGYTGRFTIPGGFLAPGSYYVSVGAHMPQRAVYDVFERTVTFDVTDVGSLKSLDGRLGVVAPLLPWDTRADTFGMDSAKPPSG